MIRPAWGSRPDPDAAPRAWQSRQT